jgi:hypothetical protein
MGGNWGVNEKTICWALVVGRWWWGADEWEKMWGRRVLKI